MSDIVQVIPVTANVHRSKYGYHPCDFATFEKLRRIRRAYFEALTDSLMWVRHQRKDPRNRVLVTRDCPPRTEEAMTAAREVKETTARVKELRTNSTAERTALLEVALKDMHAAKYRLTALSRGRGNEVKREPAPYPAVCPVFLTSDFLPRNGKDQVTLQRGGGKKNRITAPVLCGSPQVTKLLADFDNARMPQLTEEMVHPLVSANLTIEAVFSEIDTWEKANPLPIRRPGLRMSKPDLL